jgi:agmatinase
VPAPRFADAVAKSEDAKIAIFGVPYDRTCSFRTGSRFGPRAIRQASYNFESYMMDHGRSLVDVPVADLGDTPSFAATDDMVAGVTTMTADILKRGTTPIVIGGEHSLAPAVVRAFPQDIGVIGIDAHLDFRDAYLGERWSHACSARRCADHVGVEHVVYLGVRSFSQEERADLERLGLSYISVYDVQEKGIEAAVARALKLVDRDRVYLTIDIDGVDPAFAPAVGNPEPFGLSPLQVKKLLARLAPHLVGLDLNEVSPAWDFGQTAVLAARLIREAIMDIAKARSWL